jgi:hypothetical protein
MADRIKYIDVCGGEIRIGFVGEKITSVSGGPKDPVKRKFVAIDGLRQKIGELNSRLDDCITANEALAKWEVELG